jgi:transposase
VLLVQRVLEEGWKIEAAAVAQGVSERTVYRWLARWRAGDHELLDRSSAPHRVPRRTSPAVERMIELPIADDFDCHRGCARDGGVDGVRGVGTTGTQPTVTPRTR